jgi:diguanylate cyclase (GGDEF)-like protein
MTEKYKELEKKQLALQSSIQETKDHCSITGLYNQEYFNRFFTKEILNFSYAEKSFGLIFLSIDNLQSINMDFGRLEGDGTLKTLSSFMQNAFPNKEEYLFKLQGGLFAIYLPNTKRISVLERADLLCHTVSEAESFIVPVTISAGLFHTDKMDDARQFDNDTLQDVALQTTLFRLKLAKKQGGNKVVSDSSRVGTANSSISIMLIANEGIERNLIREALLLEGYHVSLAPNGLEALHCIEKDCPDIIISELMTSKLNGFSLRKELLKKSLFSDLPFILFSSNKNENTVSRSIGLGIAHFFACPVMLVELIGVVGLYASDILQREV